jgi:hypothetical protein
MSGIAQEDDDGQAAAHNGKPSAAGQAEKAAVTEWTDAITGASTIEELESLAGQLAKANLSAGAKSALRSIYTTAKGKFAKESEQ